MLNIFMFYMKYNFFNIFQDMIMYFHNIYIYSRRCEKESCPG